MNPQRVIDWDETDTASFSERLSAARRCQSAGYRLGFHFDPMIEYPSWEKDYQAMIEEMFATIDWKRLSWLSLGVLRNTPGLKRAMRERFPGTQLLTGEQVLCPDGKLRYFQPLRSLAKAGVTVGGGSDHMQKIGSLRSINPYNPFLAMQTAITRKARWYEGKLHPEESLTREQALRMYTMNNARLLFCEATRGSLEPGKLADLAVLDTDLLKCPEEKIAATRALRTYVGGKLVYRAEGQ